MRVECEIKPDARANYVAAICSRCGHKCVAHGTGEKSIKRALAQLREECPEEEDNFYVAEEAGGENRIPYPVVKPWWGYPLPKERG